MGIKKGIFLFIFFLFVSQLAEAQVKSVSGRTGLTISSIRGNDKYDQFNKKIGFLLAGSANYFLTKRCTLVIELNISQKGTNYSVYDLSINSLYVTAPVMIRYALKKPRKYFDESIKFFIMAGPYSGYLLTATEKGEIVNLDSVIQVNRNIAKEINSYDAGIIIGSGFFIPMTRKIDFYFDLRYNLGLLSLRKDNPFYEGKNTSIAMSAGFVKFFRAR